ncbi:aldehyde dehydrogenase [Sneathiella marina]|uniref:Aldehyde dehydrogenase n=1 Tax=Sneathiella marina TaxID=2950108 RepID=A0ABY4W464_9PROT|nr:aldehyde dehydrogenase [Sneathiella marina]USG60908.1 aldehyde dehydrogenase [Sneathiella marina]
MTFKLDDNLLLPLGGNWILGEGADMPLFNPADGTQMGSLKTASLAQVETTINAANEAFVNSGWATLNPHLRAGYLFDAANLIRQRAESLALLQTKENGKTLTESNGQVTSAAGIVRYFAAVCESLTDDINPARGDYLSATLHEPYGVVAAITPWNSPLTMAAQKIAPALAAGNAVILKPSELTSVVSLELARCFTDAGLPDGLLSVLPGGPDVGNALTNHADIHMISFTGGTETGRRIAKAVAPRFIPTIFELGGKSPNIVFADADLEAAAKGVTAAIFGSGGQSCVAGSRLFVEAAIYDEFMDRVRKETAKINVGDPMDSTSNIGPMASFAQRERVEEYVRIGREDGGKVTIGGARPEGPEYEHGAYYLPTIIENLSHNSRVCQEEIFGSVLCALPFDDLEQVAGMADETAFGLACGIWSKDITMAWNLGRRLQAGSVWINTYKQLSIAAPFGGYKESGLGREKGLQGLRAYQQSKSIYLGGFTS